MSAYRSGQPRRVLPFAPGSPGAARHEASVQKLAAASEAYVERYMLGDPQPVVSLAAQMDANPATVRSWIYRARLAGMETSLDAHRPRGVAWPGADSWIACTECHVEWPCQPARDWYAKRGAR